VAAQHGSIAGAADMSAEINREIIAAGTGAQRRPCLQQPVRSSLRSLWLGGPSSRHFVHAAAAALPAGTPHMHGAPARPAAAALPAALASTPGACPLLNQPPNHVACVPAPSHPHTPPPAAHHMPATHLPTPSHSSPPATPQIVKKDGVSRHFGFVTFSDEVSVEKCLVVQHDIGGRMVELKRAVPKEEVAQHGLAGGMGGGRGAAYGRVAVLW
jgi:hypothetical protein